MTTFQVAETFRTKHYSTVLCAHFVSSALYADWCSWWNEALGQKSAFSIPSLHDLGHCWWTGLLLY